MVDFQPDAIGRSHFDKDQQFEYRSRDDKSLMAARIEVSANELQPIRAALDSRGTIETVPKLLAAAADGCGREDVWK